MTTGTETDKLATGLSHMTSSVASQGHSHIGEDGVFSYYQGQDTNKYQHLFNNNTSSDMLGPFHATHTNAFSKYR